jgi:cell shape-determining protein MreC
MTDLLDSLKFVFLGQQLYRLAAFHYDSKINQLKSSNFDIFKSLLYIIVFSTEITYITQEVISADPSDINRKYKFDFGKKESFQMMQSKI